MPAQLQPASLPPPTPLHRPGPRLSYVLIVTQQQKHGHRIFHLLRRQTGRHQVQTTTPVTPKLLIIYAQNQGSNTQTNMNSAPVCLPSNKTNILTKLKKQLARNSRCAKVMRLVHPNSVLCRPFLALCAPCPAIWARQWGGTKWKFPAMGGWPQPNAIGFPFGSPKRPPEKGM